MQNTQIGSKIKNAKKVRKSIKEPRESCCVQKNRSKKQLIFEKLEHFENCQKWSQCKGYSTCKILSLDQKLKLAKTYEKRFFKHVKVVLCQKQIEETANIRKMRAFLKLPKMAAMQRL